MLIGFSMICVFSGPLLGPREMLLSRARGAYNRMPDHFLSLLLYVENANTDVDSFFNDFCVFWASAGA